MIQPITVLLWAKLSSLFLVVEEFGKGIWA